MRNLLFAFFILMSTCAVAQTKITQDTIKGRRAFVLKDVKITDFQNDTPLVSANKIPTSKAVKDFIAGIVLSGVSGITSINGQTGSTQTFSKVDDTNVTLAINSATNNHAFTLGWTGTLADGRIASASTWNAKPGGSGTTNYIVRWLGANTVGTGLIRDNGSTVGIGGAPSSDMLDVTGDIRVSGGFLKTTLGVAIGSSPPTFGYPLDILNNGTINTRIGTTTATAGGGRAILNFTAGNNGVNALPGWRIGLNTSAYNNDNFTIDELNSGSYIQRFAIEKTTGHIGLGVDDPTSILDMNSDKFRLRTGKTPLSATDTGEQGDICWDTSFIYVCIGTNTWKRVALATW